MSLSTEARREQQLRLFEAISATTPDFIYVFDLNARFLYANRRLLEVWGRTFDEAVGKGLLELGYAQWHADMHHREIRQVIETRRPIKGVVPFTGGSGISGVYEYIFSPVFGADGAVEMIAGTTRDVTDRQRAEDRATTILESITDAFFAVDRDWRFTYANRQAGIVLGRPTTELVGKELWSEYPGLAGSEFEREYRKAATERTPASVTAFYPDHDKWYEVHAYPGADGGLSIYFRDVTEQRRAAAVLRTTEERLELSVDAADLGTFYCPLPFGELVWNDKCKEHFWLAPDARVDIDTFYAVLHPDDREPTREAIARSVSGHSPYDVDYRTVAPDGRTRWVRARGRAYYDAAGNPTRFDGITLDVTEQRRAEEERRELTERYAEQSRIFDRVLSSISDFAYTFDLAGRFTFVNRPLLDLWGLTLDQAVGRDFFELNYPAELAGRLQRQIQQVIRSGERVVDTTPYTSQTGAGGYYQYIFSPVLRPDGSVIAVAGSTRDITSLKRAEARDRFLVALDDAVRPLAEPDAITMAAARLLGEHLRVDRCAYADVEADEDTMNLTGNYCRSPEVRSIVGRLRFADFGAEVLQLMRADEAFVVDDVDAHAPPIGDPAAYRATQIRAVICAPLHKNGRFVAAMAVHHMTPRRWTGDEVELVRLVAARCWESIERARVARDLRESEARFRQLADAMPQIVWAARPDGTLDYYNRRWFEFINRSPDEAEQARWDLFVHPDDLAGAREAWGVALAVGTPYEMEFRVRRADGEYRWFLVRAVAIRDEHLAVARWFGTCTDIQDRKELQAQKDQLLNSERAARAEAERTSRMKDEFLATLSHELRTPLNAILGWSQILRGGGELPGEVKEGVEIIERNARAQTQIIEDLLDMSRIISGKIRLDVQGLTLADVVRAAVETVRPAADAKGVALRAVLDTFGAPVSGDPNRLQQVFWNLLSNAVKFTPRGGRVQVVLERVNSHVEVSVIDTGEGIDPRFLPFAFDRFRQADATTTRKHGGLGLGLALVKQLVELHGGSVRVKSGGLGNGSTFTVALPLTVVHPDPATLGERRHPEAAGRVPVLEDTCVSIKGLRVLVVDDEPDARALVRRLLEDCEATVTTAGSADEALAAFREARPDLIVSDVGMPGEDGYSLIRRVRALGPEAGGDTPAIALTAYARAEDRMKAMLAGFQQHLPKPVEPAELITVVAVLSGRLG